MNPIRVAVVTQSTGGGVADYILLLLDNLSAQFQLEVLAPPDPDFVARVGRRARFKPLPLVREISPIKDLRSTLRLAQLLRTGQYDLIHLHSSKAGAVGRLASLACPGKPVIYSPHCFAFLDQTDVSRSRLYERVERALAPLAAKIVCVSEGERAEALNRHIASERRLCTIINGIDTEIFKPASETERESTRAELEIPPGRLVIGSVGRLSEQKGYRYLLDAARTILDRRPDTEFLLIGDGPLRDELHRQARNLGIASHVRFLGFRADVPRLLSAFDLFVLPSLWEGLPLALLQAMATGLPVVTTRVIGNEEVVAGSGSGLLVNPADPRELAAAILSICSDPGATMSMGNQGRTTVTERYDVRRMVRQVEALYAELAPAAV